jgi:hypothetical protein
MSERLVGLPVVPSAINSALSSFSSLELGSHLFTLMAYSVIEKLTQSSDD